MNERYCMDDKCEMLQRSLSLVIANKRVAPESSVVADDQYGTGIDSEKLVETAGRVSGAPNLTT